MRWKLALAVALVAVLALVWRVAPLERWVLALAAGVQAAGWPGVAVYGAAYIVGTVLLVPGTLMTLVAGLAWGPWAGSAIVLAAATLGACAAFLAGRRVARARLERWLAARGGGRLAALDRAVAREGWRIVLLTRLSPAFPFVFLNYAFALTGVRFRSYLAATLVGMVPGTFLYVYLGSTLGGLAALQAGALPASPARRAGWWGGLAATVLVMAYLARVASRALGASLEGRA